MTVSNDMTRLYVSEEQVSLEDLQAWFPEAFESGNEDIDKLEELKYWLEDYTDNQEELADNWNVNDLDDVFNAMDIRDSLRHNTRTLEQLTVFIDNL